MSVDMLSEKFEKLKLNCKQLRKVKKIENTLEEVALLKEENLKILEMKKQLEEDIEQLKMDLKKKDNEAVFYTPHKFKLPVQP